MRLSLAIFATLIAGPAVAQDRLQITPATAEAAPDAAALSDALLAGLAGPHAGCPVTLGEGIPVVVTHVPGPPSGWSLVMDGAPGYAATGASGDLTAAAAGILDLLCPKLGGAATTGPWLASGGGAEISMSGEVADLLAPFTLQGVFPGGQGVFEYTPVNIGGGPVTYSLSGSGVTGSGEGMYSLTALPNGVYELVQTTEGCVDGIPNSCRTNTETITLTPKGQ